MASIDDVTGEVTLKKFQRAALATALRLLKVLAKLGDADAAAAVPHLEKVVAKHPVE